MKVILKKDVARIGPRNSVHEVSDSYAINVLIKQGLADRLDKGMENKIAKQRSIKDEEQKTKSSKHLTLIKRLEEISNGNSDTPDNNKGERLVNNKSRILFKLKRKADGKGHLYGAITKEEICQAIFELVGTSLNQKQIHTDSPMRSLGEHAFTISGTAGEKEVEFRFVVIK